MINVKDLRIGNYVDYEKTTHVVIGINEDIGRDTITSWWVNHRTNKPAIEKNDDGSLNPYIRYAEYHDGIPITIDILKELDIPYDENPITNQKFGSNYDFIFYIGSIRIRFFKEDMVVYTQGDGIKSIVEIKYIHELQNLAYSLYKKELYLKEK
jgi:hypothetical protein